MSQEMFQFIGIIVFFVCMALSIALIIYAFMIRRKSEKILKELNEKLDELKQNVQ